MTEPARPSDAAPGSPTPEEISARLEALLKRTHALRAQRGSVSSGGPLSVTWPPADGDLDRYDVVDVPENERLTAAVPAGATAEPTPPEPSAAPRAEARVDFTRPDWSELRLRAPGDEAPARSPWLWLLTILLGVTALGEAAYIWHLQGTRPAQVGGLLRVDGPEGADVRVNGRHVGAAPIEHALDPGDYDVEVVTAGTVRRTAGLRVGLGRTIVLLSPGQANAPGVADAVGSSGPASPPQGDGGATGARPPTPARVPSAGTAPGTAHVSGTLGAVLIESTPAGLPVTMEGRPRGVTPITIGQVRPGRHDVLIGGLARQVDIAAGQVTPLRVSR